MEITNEIRSEILEPIHASCGQEAPVVGYISGEKLAKHICELIWNGELYGLYYNESGILIARDMEGQDRVACNF